MNKKLVLIISSFVLALAVLICGAILIVKNTGDTVITLSNATALAGDTVELPLEITKNHGIWGGQIIINYDTDAINFVSCSNGEVFDECEVNNNDGEVVLLVTQSALENTNVNGLIANLNFKIKISADKGSYDITFNADTNFCDSDEKLIELTLNKGKITVK